MAKSSEERVSNLRVRERQTERDLSHLGPLAPKGLEELCVGAQHFVEQTVRAKRSKLWVVARGNVQPEHDLPQAFYLPEPEVSPRLELFNCARVLGENGIRGREETKAC